MTAATTSSPEIRTETQDGALLLRFSGDWRMLKGGAEGTEKIKSTLAKGKDKPSRLLLELGQVGEWDTSLVALLYSLIRDAETQKIE